MFWQAEVFDLIQIVCTSTRESVEHSFSTMKRIKSITISSQREDRQPALTIISNEKNLMSKLKHNEKFYNAVSINFAKIKIKFSKIKGFLSDSMPMLKSYRPPLLYKYDCKFLIFGSMHLSN